MKYPAGGNLIRKNYYFGWTASPWGIDGNANGRLWHSKVNTPNGDGDRLYLDYRYDNTGNIQFYYDNTRWNGFEYDAQNRLTAGYRWVNWNAWQGWHTVSNDGRAYSYDAAGRLTSFEGSSYNSYRGHGITNKDSWQQRYYDANGNTVWRWTSDRGWQNLGWDAENHLATIQDDWGNLIESYLYDADGQRVKKTGNGSTTYYPFPHYEVTNGVATKYYFPSTNSGQALMVNALPCG